MRCITASRSIKRCFSATAMWPAIRCTYPEIGWTRINTCKIQCKPWAAKSCNRCTNPPRYGLGERFQLTYQIPYVLQDRSGQPTQSGWSNGYPEVTWRFPDQGEDGWHMLTFPQIETAGSQHARQEVIAAPAPWYLVPVEVAKKIGVLDVDFEAGYCPRGRGPKERILGLLAGDPSRSGWNSARKSMTTGLTTRRPQAVSRFLRPAARSTAGRPWASTGASPSRPYRRAPATSWLP